MTTNRRSMLAGAATGAATLLSGGAARALSEIDIFPIVDRSEAAASVKALPAAVREEAFALLLEAAVADGKIVDEERHYLHTVGEAMGLASAAVDARLRAALAP